MEVKIMQAKNEEEKRKAVNTRCRVRRRRRRRRPAHRRRLRLRLLRIMLLPCCRAVITSTILASKSMPLTGLTTGVRIMAQGVDIGPHGMGLVCTAHYAEPTRA